MSGDWGPEHAPRAHFGLGVSAPAWELVDPPEVSIALCSTAILRLASQDGQR
jgi:hypothetical protein